MTRFAEPLSGLLDLVFPLSCAGCGCGRTGWCADCGREIGVLRRIERPLLTSGPPVYALGRYRGPARRAVLAYKESGRRDLAEPFGRAFAAGLRSVVAPSGEPWCLIPAPSRAAVSRRRGGPHLVRAAGRAVSALADAGWRTSVADCLRLHRGARDSAALNPAERVHNLIGRVFTRTGRLPPEGVPAVLIDDVITTGATASCCLRVLESAGVRVELVLGLTATAGLYR
ncbi:ComF family protein [Parasphingorhabdus pacifica]